MRRPMLIDEFLDKIEEWVDRSEGRIRADVVHDKLVAMGFTGSERTTRRAVGAARKAWWSGHRRVFRPWVPEPGLWLQFDWGDGPRDRRPAHVVVLRVAGLVPVPGGAADLGPHAADAAGLSGRDAAPARWGADVCVDRQREDRHRRAHRPGAGPASRCGGRRAALRDDDPHVRAGGPADQGWRGGDGADRQGRSGADRGEPARRVRARSPSSQAACAAFCERGERPAAPGDRPGAGGAAGRGTGTAARAARAAGHGRVRADPPGRVGLPPSAWTGCATRCRTSTSTTGCGCAGPGTNWSSPSSTPTGRGRSPGTGAGSAAARRSATSITRPTIPAAEPLPGDRTPRAANPAEAAFLAIGDGAKAWLVEAAAAGASRVRSKMAEAVAFAKLHGAAAVDQALGTAALAGRFADTDLAAILAHQQRRPGGGTPTRASEAHSLQPGTAGWAGFGAPRRRGDQMTTAAARSRRCRSGPRSAGPSTAGHWSEVIALTRRLRLPYLRAAAVDVVPTARAQRWDPAELLRVLLAEEITGRDHATLRMRRRQANFPAGKTFARLGRDTAAPSPSPPSRRCAPWNGSTGTRTCASAGRPAPAKATSAKPSASWPSTPAAPSPGSASKNSAPWSAGTAPTTPSPKRSAASPASI